MLGSPATPARASVSGRALAKDGTTGYDRSMGAANGIRLRAGGSTRNCAGAIAVLGAILFGVTACASRSPSDATPEALGQQDAFGRAPQAPAASEGTPSGAGTNEVALGPVTKTSLREHPARVAWRFDAPERPEAIDVAQAEARGLTVIDLGNEWTPYIFTEKTPGLDDVLKNRYRRIYIGLANDKLDSEGQPLPSWGRNYLELYGIPPSLAVIKAEWDRIDTELKPCLEQAGFDPSVFTRFSGIIEYKKSTQGRSARLAANAASRLRKSMRKAKLDFDAPEDLAAAATHPKTRTDYTRWRQVQDEVDVIDHAQRRFRCERMFNSAKGEGRFTPGVFDSETTHALANFERKHDIMGWGHFKKDNLAMLATPPEESVHVRLLRAIEERVVTSAGILEDGSARRIKKSFTYKDEQGKQHELRDLVTEFRERAIEALGLQTPESAKAQLDRLAALEPGGFAALLVALPMPELPPYYGPNMAFETLIDRGDIWYDFPYDELGNRLTQPRQNYPHLTLFVHYNDQKIPLVHWRTTIGSWRNELINGEVMLKYKNSDVGARVWKDIVAAPTWIPPTSTPPSELIKTRWRDGKPVRDVNYDEIGPGFRSAYGLVAAYHIKQNKDEEGNVVAELDNAIRTHGSVDYMSILRRYSHGCHRLYNMDAVRMFSFILQHRDYVRRGQQPLGVSRAIELEEQTYQLKIDTRGYKYELVEPIPVMVTKGRIRGAQRVPVDEYVPKPVRPEENTIDVDDGSGETLTLPVPLPPGTPVGTVGPSVPNP